MEKEAEKGNVPEEYFDLKKLVQSIVDSWTYGDPMSDRIYCKATLEKIRDEVMKKTNQYYSKTTIINIRNACSGTPFPPHVFYDICSACKLVSAYRTFQERITIKHRHAVLYALLYAAFIAFFQIKPYIIHTAAFRIQYLSDFLPGVFRRLLRLF